jgi:hypothetical protein
MRVSGFLRTISLALLLRMAIFALVLVPNIPAPARTSDAEVVEEDNLNEDTRLLWSSPAEEAGDGFIRDWLIRGPLPNPPPGCTNSMKRQRSF